MRALSLFVALLVLGFVAGCGQRGTPKEAKELLISGEKGAMVQPSMADESFEFVESREISPNSGLRVAIVKRKKDGQFFQVMVDSAKKVTEGDKVELVSLQYRLVSYGNYTEKFTMIK